MSAFPEDSLNRWSLDPDDPASVDGAVQEFLAGCEWALRAFAVLGVPARRNSSGRLSVIVVPTGDERLDALFAWRRHLTKRRFRKHGLGVRAHWGVFAAMPGLGTVVRLSLDFYAPERFAYRVAMHADQALSALSLAAEGEPVFIAQPYDIEAAIPQGGIPTDALPVAHEPSPALRKLLTDIRAQHQ